MTWIVNLLSKNSLKNNNSLRYEIPSYPDSTDNDLFKTLGKKNCTMVLIIFFISEFKLLKANLLATYILFCDLPLYFS